MPKLIISYRRADSAWTARSIFDRLVAHYGKESVFMDIDDIPFGIDFRQHINDALHECDVLIAVVGPNWLGVGTGGRSRIKEPSDPVRIEVETALRREIPVIPVLVDRATMPTENDLPETLRDFVYRNAAELVAGREFHQQMDRLIRSMDRIVESSLSARSGGTLTPPTRTDLPDLPKAPDGDDQETSPAPDAARRRAGVGAPPAAHPVERAPPAAAKLTEPHAPTAATPVPRLAEAPPVRAQPSVGRGSVGIVGWLGILLMVACVSVVALGALARLVGYSSLEFYALLHGLSESLLAWLVLVGAALAVERRSHFSLETLVNRLPMGFRHLAAVLQFLVIASFSATLVVLFVPRIPTAPRIATYPVDPVHTLMWVYGAVAAGGVLLIIYAALALRRTFRETRS